MSWQPEIHGPAAVATTDQVRAELRELVTTSRAVYLVAAPAGEQAVVVRALFALPESLSDDAHEEYVATFLCRAALELGEMIETLGGEE